MLNYETLLSSYDDKLTLMQWLKKVQAALKDASATSFVLNKKGNATISFSIVFEDGTSLESGDIVLQQGESVQSAYIQNGHLHLILTNGDDLDAGALLDGNPLTIPAVNVDFVGNVLIEGALSVDGPAVIDGTTKLNTISSDEEQITALKPVIEDMTGYSFEKTNTLNWSARYAAVCKNGNKLTLVIDGAYTKASGDGPAEIGKFTLPKSIYDKIYPHLVGSVTNVVAQVSLVMWPSTSLNAAPTTIIADIGKTSGQYKIAFNFRVIGNLTNDITYNFRYELTLLLSDNLAA